MGMFDWVGDVVNTVVDTAGDVGKGIAGAVEDAVNAVGDVVEDIRKMPILGQAFDLAFSKVLPAGVVIDILRTAEKIANGKPIDQAILDAAKSHVLKTQALGDTAIRKEGYSNLYTAAGEVLQGKPVNTVGLTLLKRETAEIKKVGPYAQAVVSFVPGVGTGAAAALAAGMALSEGASLDDVALAAVKGAIPGGPLVQSAFSVAQAAAEGKPIDGIVVEALPISPQAKQGVKLVLGVAKDLAAGKKVSAAMMAQADKVFGMVSPEIAKALNVGMAVGLARALQDSILKELTPEHLNKIAEIGSLLSHCDTVLAAGRIANPSPEFHRGFDIATGALNARAVNKRVMADIRGKLSGIALQGFDASAALQAGRIKAVRKLGKRKTIIGTRKLGKKTTPDPRLIKNAAIAKMPKALLVMTPPPPEPRTFGSVAEGQRKLDEAIKAGRPAVIVTALRAMLEQTKLKEAKQAAVVANKPTPTEKAGYMIAQGLEGAAPEQKTAVVAALAANPEARLGVAQAIEDKKSGKSWVQRLLDWLFG